MLGSFNQKSLELFQEAMSESMFSDFSEGDFYDFTTCIRPDGSAYGTSGKCRKGTEGKAKEKEAAQKKLVQDFKTSEIDPVIKSAQELKNRIDKTQKNTPEYEKLQTEFGQARNRVAELRREKLLDPVSGKMKSYATLSMAAGMREPKEIGFKLKTPDSPQVKGQKEDLQKQISVAMRNGDRDRALMLKRSLNELEAKKTEAATKTTVAAKTAPKRSQVSLVTPQRVSQEDVDRTKRYIDGEKQKLQNLNDSVKNNPEFGKDPEVQKRKKALEGYVKGGYESLTYLLDKQAAED